MWHFNDNIQVVLTTGVPASGKSTFAQCLPNFLELNLDNIREELSGDHTNQNATLEAVSLRNKRLMEALEAGERIIISDTNLNPSFRNQLVEMLVETGVPKKDIAVAHFQVDREEVMRRNSLREKPVPFDVMDYFFYVQEQEPPSEWAEELGLPYFEFK
jgi:predicted kinase